MSEEAARRDGWLVRLWRQPSSRWSLVVVGFIAGLALVAPLLPLADPARTDLAVRLLRPGSAGHWLGTDQLGRDLLSRLLAGTRLSLLVACAGSSVAALLGSLLGLAAGYRGGLFDGITMRALDVLLAFPYLLLAIAIVAALGPGLANASLAIALVNVPFFARTVRGVTLELREAEFVLAARVGGLSRLRVMLHELLPNVLPTIAIASTTSIGWVLLETAGLSFLGLGAQPPQADLGGMLGEGRHLLAVAPHVSLMPGALILVLVAALNLLGDGLRDVLDPRLLASPSNTSNQEASRGEATVASAPLPPPQTSALCQIHELTLAFGHERVLEGVSLQLAAGERVALVGESGSGKSLTARALLGLLPPGAVRVAGEVWVAGQPMLERAERARRLRGRKVALVPQDPLGSLHPLFRVGAQIGEVLEGLPPREARARAVALCGAVQLPEPGRVVRRYPHELSGGQRQRVAIAMALAGAPQLLVADEPTTALDVTTQRAILTLLRGLAEQHHMALLLVTHDLAVAAELCQRVLVMQRGRIVEQGPLAQVFAAPQHAYTQRLLRAAERRSRAGALG